MKTSHEKALLWRATTATDRWLMVVSALLISGFAGFQVLRPAGDEAVIERDNQIIMRLPLNRNKQIEVQGNLGAVAIQVQNGQVRLLEYASPRLIGTRSGWISRSGAMVACVPCGILIRVEGEQTETNTFDGIAR